jgi:flagellar basal-body rod modification protein FlgD
MTISPTAAGSAASASGGRSNFDLNSEDFVKMMITQLQNQDPMEPAKNEQLLAQMSQIGQLESSTKLQTSLESMVLQNSLGAAGNLIGREVQGITTFGDETVDVTGVVTSVRVEGGSVQLELDTGHKVPLNNVVEISPASAAA